MKQRVLALVLSFLMLFQAYDVFAVGKEQEKVDLTLEQDQGMYMEISVIPKEAVKKIETVTTDSVHQHKKTGYKGSIGWSKDKLFAVDESAGKLYIPVLKDKHTLSLNLAGGQAYHYILKDKTFEKIDMAHPPKGKLHIKLEGYFEGALVGQKKYDGISGATGSVKDNKNSNVKLYGQITNEGEGPKANAWQELSKSNIQVDKGQTRIVLDKASGMIPSYNALESAITLAGEPKKSANYPVYVELVDIYGRKAKSNTIWFSVSDIENTYLDQVMTDVNTRLKKTPNGKVLFNQEPWYIAYFNKNNKGQGQSYVVPKNINLWQGSHESGTYGQLGLVLGVKENPDPGKFEYKPEEDRIPIQEFIVPSGANLTLVNMKVFSGVNIVVQDGAILNIHDSSIYGKITVEKGGRLRVNYDPEGKILSGDKKVLSASSIQGQIILKDGAILEDSYIYSNTNNLTDAGRAIRNTRPVVKVLGHAFIKGNVFIKGDESPTGSDKTNKPYRGQGALAIDGGSLTLLEDANLYLYGGGTKQTTSRGGNALSFANGGQILGKGSLVAIGGRGASGEGGFAAQGEGTISVAKAYLEAGGGAKNTLAKDEAVKITRQVVGQVKNRENNEAPGAYWNQSSVPKLLKDADFGDKVINPKGDQEIKGKDALKLEDPAPKKGPKRVEFETNQFNNKSLTVKENSQDSFTWIQALAQGKGKVTLQGKPLSLVEKESLGYKVEGRFLYIYGLNLKDIVKIDLEGYVPVQLQAVESGNNNYRLEPYQETPEEAPYLPEKEIEITDEKLEEAKAYMKGLVLDEKALGQAGLNSDKNSANIEAFKNAVKKAKALAEKENLTKEEKEDLVRLYETKFAQFADKLLVDMHLQDEKTVPNKHDKLKLHAKLKEGKVHYTSDLESLSKDGYPKVEVYRIDKATYEADATTGATPKFEDNKLGGQYFDVQKVDEKYQISVKEEDLLKTHPDTALVKIAFKVKLADGIYATGNDFVFLNPDKKQEDQPKQKDKPKKDKQLIEEKDPESTPPKKKESHTNSGHWEYRLSRKLRPLRVVQEAEVQELPFIVGYPNGLFMPQGKVTRAEAANMVYKLERKKASSLKPAYKDTRDTWYNEAINFTTSENMLLPKDGYIRPDEAMTRAEFARMLAPLLPKKEGVNSFTDIENHEFKADILRAFANGVVYGYPDKSFKPDGKIARSEAVAMLNRVYKKYVTKAELEQNKDKIKHFKDVPESHWAYMDIMSAINYPILNPTKKEDIAYTFSYGDEWTKVWVEDKKTPEPSPEKEKTFKNQRLEEKNQAIVEGEMEEGAKLLITHKTKTEDGKLQHIVPKTILDHLKTLKAPEGKIYDVVQSYDVRLTKETRGSLKVNLFVGDMHNGKAALIKHLAKDGLKTYQSRVENGYVSCTVHSLSPFVVLLEEDMALPKPEVDQDLEKAKEALKTAIESAKGALTKKEAYTEDSVESLEKALKSAEALRNAQDKKAIQGATQELNKALSSLVEKPKIDQDLEKAKAALAQAIQKAQALPQEGHTKKSADALKDALSKAEKLKDASDKEEIEAATAALKKAIKSLEKLGDVDALKAKIKEAKEKEKDNSYTDDSKQALKESLKIYEKVDYENASQTMVNKAISDIDKALKALVKKPVKTPVDVNINSGDNNLLMLKGTLGKTFGDLKTEEGKSFTLVDGTEENKVFTGWKLDEKSGLLTTAQLAKTTITQDMIGDDGTIFIEAQFKKAEKPSEKKKVLFTEPATKSIRFNKEDLATSQWAQALQNGQGTVEKHPSGEAIQKATGQYAPEGYYIFRSGSLKINGLSQGDLVKITVQGYEDVYLMAKALGSSYQLVVKPKTEEETPGSKKDQDLEKAKEELKKAIQNIEKYLEDQGFTEDSRNKLKAFLTKKDYKNFDYNQATLEELEGEIQAITQAYEGLEYSIVPVIVNDGSEETELMGILNRAFESFQKKPQGSYEFKDPVQKGKIFQGWQIKGKGELRSTEALKKTKLTGDMVQEGRSQIIAIFKDEKPAGKQVKFADPKNNRQNKIYLDNRDADSTAWLTSLQEKASLQVKKGHGYVDIEKKNISIYNKPSTKSLTIKELKDKDLVKITLEGYQDVYLKVENGKLLAMPNPDAPEGTKPATKPRPKLERPMNSETNILNNASPDPNTLAWYQALKEGGRITANGLELTKKREEFGPEKGYYLDESQGTVRIRFRHLNLNEVISIEVEGWPKVIAKVIDFKQYSGPTSEKEAVFQIM